MVRSEATRPKQTKGHASGKKDNSQADAMDVASEQVNLQPIRIKILTLGSPRTGKSCFVKKYCEKNRFASSYVPTIGVDYGVKPVTREMDDGSLLNIKIDFFDLSGDPNYKDVRNEFYSDVDAVILIYDVTDKVGFEALATWVNEAREFGVSTSNTTWVVVGNKSDLYPRVVSEDQVRCEL